MSQSAEKEGSTVEKLLLLCYCSIIKSENRHLRCRTDRPTERKKNKNNSIRLINETKWVFMHS